MPLQFCKLLIVSVTSLIAQGTMNIESKLGFGKVSNIEIVLETIVLDIINIELF